MPRSTYVNLSLPKPLIDEVDEFINKNQAAYSSRPEFIKYCIRKELGLYKR